MEPSGHRLHQDLHVLTVSHLQHSTLEDLLLAVDHVGVVGLLELSLHPNLVIGSCLDSRRE